MCVEPASQERLRLSCHSSSNGGEFQFDFLIFEFIISPEFSAFIHSVVEILYVFSSPLHKHASIFVNDLYVACVSDYDIFSQVKIRSRESVKNRI